jgi:seryl-tRNA(Sec) selenium transferase
MMASTMPAAPEIPGLAGLLGAEAALATPSGGAALLLALATCLAPGRRGVAIQRGQCRDIGGSPLRLIAMAGGEPREIGLADRCRIDEAEVALVDAALGLFVVDADLSAPGLLDLPRFAWACRAAGRPVVAHLGHSRAWVASLDAGAGLVVLDLALALGGTGGVVAGDAALVALAARERDRLPALYAAGEESAAGQVQRWLAAGGAPEPLPAAPAPDLGGAATW